METYEKKLKLIRQVEVGLIKKAFPKPKLTVLGDIRAFTLGGSPGIGEGSKRYKRTLGSTSESTSYDESDPYAPSDPGSP